tara:strand:- start:4461 stop:4769 length:309 start_codon:yes stop_codon:yes gene_type:complete
MDWEEIIKYGELQRNSTPRKYSGSNAKKIRDPHGTAISEGYEEQLVEEYQGMITELIHDLEGIQKLNTSSKITRAIVKFIKGPYDDEGANLAEWFDAYGKVI